MRCVLCLEVGKVLISGVDPEKEGGRGEGGALYVGPGWPAWKILGFRFSKKAEITSETIGFLQKISISIFIFSRFLSIKSYQFFKIY